VVLPWKEKLRINARSVALPKINLSNFKNSKAALARSQ